MKNLTNGVRSRPADDSEVLDLKASLREKFQSLPAKGPTFTAIWPLWPFFILCVSSSRESEQRELRGIMEDLSLARHSVREYSKRNVTGFGLIIATERCPGLGLHHLCMAPKHGTAIFGKLRLVGVHG